MSHTARIAFILFSGVLADAPANGEEPSIPKVVSAVPEPDSVKQAAVFQARRQELIILASTLPSASVIDTLSGLTEEERIFLQARYRILHPID